MMLVPTQQHTSIRQFLAPVATSFFSPFVPPAFLISNVAHMFGGEAFSPPSYNFNPMKSIYPVILPLVVLSYAASPAGQTQKQSAPADHLGFTCAQILQISTVDWIKRFTAAKDATEPNTIQAISTYGKCYDVRTTRLAASLGKSGKGPLMGTRGNFGDFEHALNDFTAKALAATDPPGDAQKKAYATLYEKQFRYDFYRQYQQKNFNPPPLTLEESEAFTKAKNHFGELLGLLPEDKMHELHRSFGEIFAAGGVPDATKLAVYRYSIFLLESPSETPYSPPPF